MVARLSALVIWALVAASAVFWGLRLTARPPQAPPNVGPVADAALRGDLTRLFGAPAVAQQEEAIAPDAAARYQLLGVIAPKGPRAARQDPYGVALIAVDGQPPKAYKVGAVLEDDLVLQSVGLRTAAIGPAQGKTALTLELPVLPPPTTGTLPAAGMGANGVPANGMPAAGARATPGMRNVPPGLRHPNGMPFQPGGQQQMPQPNQQPEVEPIPIDQSPTPAD
jgi:general secretion pathway protein C